MRKGDEKRQDILTVAEKLFYTKGFDETSVQDILDVLGASKGSFYHHFESKDSVLETLCRERAERARDQAEEELQGCDAAMARLNTVLRESMPLRREEIPFLSMALPLLFRPEGRALRACYEAALRESFLPLMTRELDAAADAGVIAPPQESGLPTLVLSMAGSCWTSVAQSVISGVKSAKPAENAELLDELNLYREAMERILDAPYGSIEWIRLEELSEVVAAVTRRMQLPMEG